MPKRFPLEAAMTLTQKQADAMAVELSALRTRERSASDTLSMLEDCRRDYQLRLERNGRSGIDHTCWTNYQEFLRNLDRAIAQQTKVLALCRQQTQAGLGKWQAARIKLKAFEVLMQRQRRDENLLQTRIEQRNQDENGAAGHRRHQLENKQ
jgi:flagellar protein FliJ